MFLSLVTLLAAMVADRQEDFTSESMRAALLSDRRVGSIPVLWFVDGTTIERIVTFEFLEEVKETFERKLVNPESWPTDEEDWICSQHASARNPTLWYVVKRDSRILFFVTPDEENQLRVPLSSLDRPAADLVYAWLYPMIQEAGFEMETKAFFHPKDRCLVEDKTLFDAIVALDRLDTHLSELSRFWGKPEERQRLLEEGRLVWDQVRATEDKRLAKTLSRAYGLASMIDLWYWKDQLYDLDDPKPTSYLNNKKWIAFAQQYDPQMEEQNFSPRSYIEDQLEILDSFEECPPLYDTTIDDATLVDDIRIGTKLYGREDGCWLKDSDGDDFFRVRVEQVYDDRPPRIEIRNEEGEVIGSSILSPLVALYRSGNLTWRQGLRSLTQMPILVLPRGRTATLHGLLGTSPCHLPNTPLWRLLLDLEPLLNPEERALSNSLLGDPS